MSDAANSRRSLTANSASNKDSHTTTLAPSNLDADAGAATTANQIEGHADFAALSKQVDKLHINGGEERNASENTSPQNGVQAQSVQADGSACGYTSSIKINSPDNKSMVSTTTCTMDEKESLRPDDSASVQATEDDDNISTTLSANNPRPGDAFSMQKNSVNGAPFSPHGYPLEPDEKLIDAMNSPKDRLLVLQLEKRIIDFIRNSRYVCHMLCNSSSTSQTLANSRNSEQSLELPPSNAFGRLLAHKLGDYYHLTHFVDNNVTSVRLHRTPYCRL